MAKKEFTIEELQAQYEALGIEIEARKKAEAEEREAKLAAEKEARRTEIETLEEKLIELREAYIKDYGSYHTTRSYDEDIIAPFLHWFF